MLLFTIPGTAQESPRVIAIEIQGKAEFDVIHHRALGNAAGVLLEAVGPGLGLIGAGIQAGAEASADAKKREAIYPHIAGQPWRDIFIRTMTDSLAEKGLETVWIDSESHQEPGIADIYVVLYPAKFGFRIVDSTSKMMASFVEFEAAYSTEPISGDNKPVKEPFYLTDKSQVMYDRLIEDAAEVHPRIESVLKVAARRLTNKIYYNTE